MKKISILTALIGFTFFLNAENLVINSGFEGWVDGMPSYWIPIPNSTNLFTVSQEKTIVSEGTSSFRVVADNNQDAAFHQLLKVTPGVKYQLSIDYYVVTGDENAVGLNSNFKKGEIYFTNAELANLNLSSTFKDVNGKSLALKGSIGSWHTYTCEFNAPQLATEFDFLFQIQKKSTALIDNRYFGEKPPVKITKVIAGNTSEPSQLNDFKVIVLNNNLLKINAKNGSVVKIFDISGTNIQTGIVNDELFKTINVPKGIYVVHVGENSQKITL